MASRRLRKLVNRCRRRRHEYRLQGVQNTLARYNSDIEKRFRKNIQSWRTLIERMLAKWDNDDAGRFMNLCPHFDEPIKSVTEIADFCAFIDDLIHRRDKENCDPDELGGLAQLSVVFQHEVEERIGT